MFFEIAFSAAALWCIVRLGALARICVFDRNYAGAAMLIIFSVILAAFSIFGTCNFFGYAL